MIDHNTKDNFCQHFDDYFYDDDNAPKKVWFMFMMMMMMTMRLKISVYFYDDDDNAPKKFGQCLFL